MGRLRNIGRLRAGGGADADAAAWAAAVTANGGTYSAATMAAVSSFTRSAKASGYWTKLNRINLFCGNQLAAAMVPLKVGGGSATETNINFVGGDYTEATGLTGNGTTKFLRTGLIPSTSLTLNDTHLAIYNRSSTGSGSAIGAQNSASQRLDLFAPFSDAAAYSEQYNGTAAAGQVSAAALAAPFGLVVGSRTASNAHDLYRNGASLASNAGGGGTLPSIELYIFNRNNNGLADTVYCAQAFAAYSIGSGLSAGDVTAYNTHMQTFQTALGRNV